VRVLIVLAALVAGCGARTPDESEIRQFGRGEPIEDRAVLDTLLHAESPYVRRAAELKDQVDRDNRADLAFLAAALRGRGGAIEAAVARLEQERTTLTALKARLDAAAGDERGLPELRTSLVKLLGNDTYSG
jgi:hypothetical protein